MIAYRITFFLFFHCSILFIFVLYVKCFTVPQSYHQLAIKLKNRLPFWLKSFLLHCCPFCYCFAHPVTVNDFLNWLQFESYILFDNFTVYKDNKYVLVDTFMCMLKLPWRILHLLQILKNETRSTVRLIRGVFLTKSMLLNSHFYMCWIILQ